MFLAPLLALGLLLSGCTEPEPEPVATPTPTPTQTTQTPEPEPEPVYETAPLTGVEYLEGENPFLLLPAVSAKVDNTTAGRPQLALNDADIVYVTRVESGLTRLLPVWHSRMPEAIGPVRSVRPIDPAVIDPYHGVFVYSGGQAPFKKAVRATGLVMSDEDTEIGKGTYYRDKDRRAPWNLMFYAQKLQLAYKDSQPLPPAHFEFAAIPTAVTDGATVSGLVVKYPQMSSKWDLGTASFPWAASSEPAWLRTQDGKVHVQANGDQVVAKNIVVMEVVHDLSFVDPKYGAIPKAKLENNQGIAHIFSDGYYLKGSWSKADSEAGIKLFTEAGEPIKLAIGNTWVEMMDTPRSTLTIAE
jgi:hypothetical protein